MTMEDRQARQEAHVLVTWYLPKSKPMSPQDMQVAAKHTRHDRPKRTLVLLKKRNTGLTDNRCRGRGMRRTM